MSNYLTISVILSFIFGVIATKLVPSNVGLLIIGTWFIILIMLIAGYTHQL